MNNTVNKIINEEINKLKRSVLKENGNGPIIAYHYSDDEFETFDKKHLGQNTEYASGDLGVTSKIGFWFNTGGKNFDDYYNVKYEADLDIKDPIHFTSVESLADEIISYYEDAQDFVQQMKDMGYDGIEVEDEEFGGISYVAFEPEQIRIIKEEIKKLIKENFATSQPEKFWDKIESLGFEHRLTKSEYEGSYNVNNRQYFLPQRLCNDKVIRRLERLCNVYGMRIYKRTGGQDFYGNDGMTFHIETEHQQQARHQPTILYHATPIEKVDKILRMGLSPRDEGKRGEFRGNRIYLAQTYDTELFHNLFAPKTFLDDYKEYRVLKVNLNKIREEQRPTLYDDNLAPGCFYTTDSIPPQALTLLRDKHNAYKQTYQEIIDKFCKKHNLQYHIDNSCVIGNPFSRFTRGLLINGTINKDGNTTITLTTNIQDISIGNEPNEDKWEVDIKLKLENNKLKRPKYKKSLGNKITGNADKIIRFIESMTGEK